MMNLETNLPQLVRQFMQTGGASTKGMNGEQACLYTGLQLEEMAEKLEAVATGCVNIRVTEHLELHAQLLRELSAEFKSGRHRGDILRANREALLDADIDLAWVALGGAFSIADDLSGAIAEVGRANLDKFPGGEVIRDENGKIKKPAGWRGPDLTPYFTESER